MRGSRCCADGEVDRAAHVSSLYNLIGVVDCIVVLHLLTTNMETTMSKAWLFAHVKPHSLLGCWLVGFVGRLVCGLVGLLVWWLAWPLVR